MSKAIEQIVEQLEKLTLSETVDFIKFCEERWGVSAAASAVATGPVTAIVEEEETEKEVILTAMGEKIKTIKALREVNSDLSLMEAKKAVEEITESTPYSLGKFDKSKAEELIKKFQELNTAPKLK